MNQRGRRQERIMGIDLYKISNLKVQKKRRLAAETTHTVRVHAHSPLARWCRLCSCVCVCVSGVALEQTHALAACRVRACVACRRNG